jgi:enhancing lycopene biosynthesis protein 2
MVRVGVVLSGCGVQDGSEIHESVLALLALDRAGAEIVFLAPNVEIAVVDHLTGKPSGEKRNALVESARIARGKIRDVKSAKASELDALVFPGGFGAAKTLCDFAAAGEKARVQPDVGRLLAEMLRAKKPICAICIAPAVLAAALRDQGLQGTLTIGTDVATAQTLEKMGAHHEACPVDRVCIDEEHRLVSTPAYMLAGRIHEAATGIERAIGELLRMAR